MNDYYCENCKNIVGEWNNKHKFYDVISFCYRRTSKNNKFIFFLDCKKCNKYVGLLCSNACEICFGENKKISVQEKLKKWFVDYKKIEQFDYICKICDKPNFESQYWFMEELTFHKK